jgi:c-di-AMP phosphodiesterase-like protein
MLFIIVVLSFIIAVFIAQVFGKVWVIFLPVILFNIHYFLSYTLDKKSPGEIYNDWKTSEFDQIPEPVRKFFLRSIFLNEENVFQWNSTVYIALFSNEHKFAVKEVRTKEYSEEVYITKTSTESKTIDIKGEIFYYELIVIFNTSKHRKINFHYLD